MDPALKHRLEEAAIAWFDSMPALMFNSLTLFAEPTAKADFVVVEQFRIGS